MKPENVPASDTFKMYHIKEQNKESIGSFHPIEMSKKTLHYYAAMKLS